MLTAIQLGFLGVLLCAAVINAGLSAYAIYLVFLQPGLKKKATVRARRAQMRLVKGGKNPWTC